ncbi:protein-L-isoaspartate(D-aspartate) O-methyltransferase [Salibacter halophilus]|uniref:Protein-L-isoaspartate O-methyltransferase n=1 Tax=Salibacter halophilus TaxID=1803916 RepID=A0A6N6M3D7_9FLAO|nr:protein-L-isoaspartate(D-aspartate) O-methyltransferase [Salibacter halophilus]KAB1061804.1 protein-L-isoaspartate(D-aspartate) O-methyltransferase [Salibacter halophilus]
MLREDSLKFKGARKRLIDKVGKLMKDHGVEDNRVLTAMMEVPRHIFFDSVFDQKFAYENTAFKIGAGQTISQPFTVAIQSALLEVKKRDKILEIGTGSGYQAAVLLAMGAKVFTVERQKLLYDKAKDVLPALGYRPRMFYGDGFKGLPSYAPFDGVIVTCGAPYVPEALIDQLKPGGKAVIPVGDGDTQKMLRIIKNKDGSTKTEDYGDFSFVPMLQNTAK